VETFCQIRGNGLFKEKNRLGRCPSGEKLAIRRRNEEGIRPWEGAR